MKKPKPFMIIKLMGHFKEKVVFFLVFIKRRKNV